MSRAAIAILSTENLLHNLSVIKQQTPHAGVIAMVKANAYGHGLRSVAARLENQVDSLGVSSIDEALALRHAGIKAPITLLEGVFEPDELLIASCQNFEVVFHNQQQLTWLSQSSLPRPIKVWLKLDTGMGRLGFDPQEAKQAYQLLTTNSLVLKPVSILSHFACADTPNAALNQQQITQFEQFIHDLSGKKSLSNSAGIFAFPIAQYDVVRPGIALYGASPFPHKSAQALNLKPVMTLQTRLIAIKIAEKGTSIGYGGRFICPEKMPIGVIAIGYGDGYPRTAQDGTPVLINQTRCPIVGRVSMDMATVDLRPYPNAKAGDSVILWGENLPIEEVAKFTQNIPYDLLSGIQSRIRYHWTLPDPINSKPVQNLARLSKKSSISENRSAAYKG